MLPLIELYNKIVVFDWNLYLIWIWETQRDD